MNRAEVEWLMMPGAAEEPLTLADFLRRPAWHARAACRGTGPADYVRGEKADYTAARARCGTCPVRQECLEEALADESLKGCWGGTDEAERRELRRRRVA